MLTRWRRSSLFSLFLLLTCCGKLCKLCARIWRRLRLASDTVLKMKDNGLHLTCLFDSLPIIFDYLL